MVIKGFTDVATLANSKPKSRIKVYKGTMKEVRGGKKISGKDLKTFFRIETGCDRLAAALVKAYSSEAEQEDFRRQVQNIAATAKGKIPLSSQSVYLSKIDLYLADKDREKTFETKNVRRATKADDISGIISECDGETIYLEYEGYVNKIGHKRKRAKNCNEPCEKKGNPFADCPLGCKQQGEFIFYLRGLFELGVIDTTLLLVTGYEDVSFLSKFLYRIEQERGNIKTAVNSVATSLLIPYQLTRKKVKIQRPILNDQYKATGKKTEDYTYAVSLNIDPAWLAWDLQNKKIEQAKLLGYSISEKQIKQVYDIELDNNVKRIAPATITEKDIKALQIIYKEHNWDEESFLILLKDHFNTNNPQDIYNFTYDQYNKLYSLLVVDKK